MQAIDLHVHSTRSDGTFTPTELVKYAAQKNLKAFALTDHDTIEGLDEAMEAAKSVSIEVIPGIELSCEYCFDGHQKGDGVEVHIVGLFLDYKRKEFVDQLENFRNERVRRNIQMCDNLREAGIDITFEKLQAEYPDSVITRAHYAAYLLKYGFVKEREQAFAKYIGDHTPYFVPREMITPEQAIHLILSAGGVPVLAHPMLYHLSDQNLDALVKLCKDEGCVGIEAIYASHAPADERQVRRLAKKYGLLISGGSDFHGTNKMNLDLGTGYGKLFVPEDLLDPLRDAAQQK